MLPHSAAELSEIIRKLYFLGAGGSEELLERPPAPVPHVLLLGMCSHCSTVIPDLFIEPLSRAYELLEYT